jgi:small subunit ribosomal protein S21
MSKKRAVNVEVSLKEVRGDQNKLIKRFIKKVKKLDILREYRERRFYEKPSAKRRRLKKRKVENAKKAEQERNKKLDIR